MNGLALFAGAGGLELGLSIALGKHYRTIAYVEREATSAAVLAANMERGWLDKAPIWSDVTTFTGDAVSPLVDSIDIISAGFPCQPWSVAGKKLGVADERWLWDDIRRLAVEIRPRYIFLENTPGLLVHNGIGTILGDLASIGFDAEWTSIRASDVGAPHRRERVFILAANSDSKGRARYIPVGSVSKTGQWNWRGKEDLQLITDAPHRNGNRWAKPLLRRMDNGASSWVDRLRIIGNGVVPQQAALAYALLSNRLNNVQELLTIPKTVE